MKKNVLERPNRLIFSLRSPWFRCRTRNIKLKNGHVPVGPIGRNKIHNPTIKALSAKHPKYLIIKIPLLSTLNSFAIPAGANKILKV